jgi:hypothetical protein
MTAVLVVGRHEGLQTLAVLTPGSWRSHCTWPRSGPRRVPLPECAIGQMAMRGIDARLMSSMHLIGPEGI